MGFARGQKGRGLALAMEATGRPPGELLNMDPLELRFTVSLASGLEGWRWEQWQKLMGGK